MSSNTYHVGDLVTLTAYFSAVGSGQPTDSTTVVFTVRKPDGSIVTPIVSHSGTGQYVAQVVADQPGLWKYRAVGSGTGTAQGANQDNFVVEPYEF